MTSTISYGLWPSDIDARIVASSSVRYGEPQFYQNTIIWSEGRPAEKGRSVLVAKTLDESLSTDQSQPFDLLPTPFSARSKVHEYGGGAFLAAFDQLFFVHAADQNLYRMPIPKAEPTNLAEPKLLLADEHSAFADMCADTKRRRLIMVRELCTPSGETLNTLIACNVDGQSSAPRVLASGHDFYANPRVSPDGRYLSFLTWDHPHLPWDSSQLWLAEITENGELAQPRCIAGISENGKLESLFQPQWFDANTLYFVSDGSEWWNLYRFDVRTQQAEPVFEIDGECATPQWTFNMSCYAFCGHHALVAVTQNGQWRLAQVALNPPPENNIDHVQWLDIPYTSLASLCTDGQSRFAFIGAHAKQSPAICYGHLNTNRRTPFATPLHDLPPLPVSVEHLSEPQAIDIPGIKAGQKLHAFFYPPTHAEVRASVTEKPPCIVICHGGPTGATDTSLNWKIQYWTNRGFAVLDVNYRGSTGYGRKYRDALKSAWGVADVEDLARAANYLRDENKVHPQRIAIRGSSAGGFTVLACLTDTDVFNAGVSLYGVADLEVLACDTHKFESRYLDSLIGPYPQTQQTYIARSPIYKVSQIACPVAIYQGLKDKVVPPNQAEVMYEALKMQGTPVAKIEYPDEAHGFRQAETIAHQLRTELAFYRQAFGLPSDEDEASILAIDNFPATQGR